MSLLPGSLGQMRIVLVLDFPDGCDGQAIDTANILVRQWVAPRHLIGARGGWVAALGAGHTGPESTPPQYTGPITGV